MTIGLLRAFGVSGFLSLLLWAGALAGVLAAWWRGGRRLPARLAAAAVAALLAVLLARPAASRIAWIEEDRSEEVARAAEAAAAAEGAGKVTVRFAEETATVKAPEPAYRERGLQARSRAESAAGDGADPGPALSAGLDSPPEPEGPVVLRMHREALHRARRLDRANRFGAAAVFWLALALLLTDYLRMFYSTTECRFPLPISGPLLDRLLTRPPVAYVSAEALSALPETIVRRGETFIYCGSRADRVSPAERLPRWRLGALATGWLPKLTTAGNGDDLEFLLDAVWFGRAFVMLHEDAAANRLLDALHGYLAIRQITRARAAHAVYIIWDVDHAEINPLREALMAVAPSFNLHWIIPTGR